MRKYFAEVAAMASVGQVEHSEGYFLPVNFQRKLSLFPVKKA